MFRIGSTRVRGFLLASSLAVAGCHLPTTLAEMPVGSDVLLETKDGHQVEGTLTELNADSAVIVEMTGARHELSRESVAKAQLIRYCRVCAP